MHTKTLTAGIAGLMALSLALPAFAEDGRSGTGLGILMGERQERNVGVLGTVTSVSGSSFAMTTQNGTTLTVDAASATIRRYGDNLPLCFPPSCRNGNPREEAESKIMENSSRSNLLTS